MNWNEILNAIIVALAPVLVGLLVYAVRRLVRAVEDYLSTKVGNEELNWMKGVASTVVRSLEQSPAYQEWGGEDKKKFAILGITQWAEKYGLKLEYETVDMLLEEAVQQMNAEFSES